MKLKNSLLSKYLLIILLAMIVLPVSFPLISLLFYLPAQNFDIEGIPNQYQSGTDLEKMWHSEAEKLAGATDDQINNRLLELKAKYKKADLFWVDESGTTRLKLPETMNLPDQWSPGQTIDFMKKSYDADPFTIVTFIGSNQNEGFMVFQVKRAEMKSTGQTIQEKYDYVMVIGMLLILALFVFVSWVFFYKIRKRLLRLQEAMARPANNGIPGKIEIDKLDEIGRLEEAFNDMVTQLETSRLREQEEEELRKQLIANLSHDLRTPLTTIRGHAYRLKNESLSETGLESVKLIDQKIGYVGELIENLLSYTLLSAGKYPFKPEHTDIVRFARTSVAAWYPVFERAKFEIVAEFPEQAITWYVDPQWLQRILDNLFQNVLRHAAAGKYIKIAMNERESSLIITDHGPGVDAGSEGKGAGVGLSIVALMAREMKLDWKLDSSETGTIITLKPKE
ncbi:sensor histidine kinase [Bacillus sp. T33-2]|uniref:sensor histidine kinase n=1 Tax=Bacillus sp. T33-2 TaxID=2054168 RepID=UPI000C7629A6|nr:HAMP domain-containing sensor histidine kinase [Bacillus sp. T33-2]PLR96560.1 sensor histidine kinase [Bacillus sp. T33-2]